MNATTTLDAPPRCGRAGCNNVAEWYPVLEMRAEEAPPHTRAPVEHRMFDVFVCERCRSVSIAEDFLAVENWDDLVGGFKARCRGRPPRRELTTLAFMSIQSGKQSPGPVVGRA